MNKTIIGGVLAAGLLVVAGLAIAHLTDHDHTHKDDHSEHEHHDEHESETVVAKEPVRADGTFSIATSFYPLAFALEQIVGDLGVVTNIGAGRDPHDFRPSMQDIVTLQQADVVILQGAAFEPWGEEIEAQLEREAIPVIIATHNLALREAGEHGHEKPDGHEEEHENHDEHEESDHTGDHHEEETSDDHGHNHGAYDPHTWLDPVLFGDTVAYLTTAISTLDPENADVYAVNAAALQAELAALNTEYETALASCATSEVITSHDAFGYVAERYNFTIHAIAGLSTQDLPSAQTLAELREEAAEGVNAILLEENSVTAYGETLANETGLATLSINPVAYVIPDGEDYLSLMRANLSTFSEALVCNE